ncbi:MAG: hypothetical protein QXJ48_05975 [Candidatus Korarchaeum sp.]
MRAVLRFITENFGDLLLVIVGYVAKYLLEEAFSFKGLASFYNTLFTSQNLSLAQILIHLLPTILVPLLLLLNYLAFFILLKLVFRVPGLFSELSEEIGAYTRSPIVGYLLNLSLFLSLFFTGIPEGAIKGLVDNFLFKVPLLSDAIASVGTTILKVVLRIAVIITLLIILAETGFVLMDEVRTERRGPAAIAWLIIGIIALLGASTLYGFIRTVASEVGFIFDSVWNLLMGVKG